MFEKLCMCVCVYVGGWVDVCVYQFSGKTYNFEFYGPNLPKMDLGSEAEKSNVGKKIRIVEILYVLSFSQNRQL